MLIDSVAKIIMGGYVNLIRLKRSSGALSNILLSVFCSLMIVDCAHSANDQSGYSEALVIHPDAENVRFYRVEGTEQVAYEIAENYPAKRVIAWVSGKLSEMQWRPLGYNVLNPGIKSSHIIGWQRFIDETSGEGYEVHHWLADWQNTYGDVVLYELRYRYARKSKPNLTRLEVSATYIPAHLLKRVQ